MIKKPVKWIIYTCICMPLIAISKTNPIYFSLGLNFDRATVNQTLSFNSAAISDPTYSHVSFSTKTNVFAPIFGIGYIFRQFNPCYLALSATVVPTSHSFSTHQYNLNETNQLGWKTALNLNMGYSSLPYQSAYITIGAVIRNLHTTFGGNRYGNTFAILARKNANLTLFGAQVGVGWREQITNHWGYQLVYYHTFWSTSSADIKDARITSVFESIGKNLFSGSSDSGFLVIDYYFWPRTAESNAIRPTPSINETSLNEIEE